MYSLNKHYDSFNKYYLVPTMHQVHKEQSCEVGSPDVLSVCVFFFIPAPSLDVSLLSFLFLLFQN